MQNGEVKRFGNYFVKRRDADHSEAGTVTTWSVGEVAEGGLHYSSEVGPKSYDDAVKWIKDQVSNITCPICLSQGTVPELGAGGTVKCAECGGFGYVPESQYWDNPLWGVCAIAHSN